MSQTRFATHLRALRKARGLTQRDLAGDKLSVSYVSLLEAGKRQPTMETARILADALACDVHELLESVDNEQPLALVLAQADLALEAGQIAGALDRYEQVLTAEQDDPGLIRRARIGQAQALQRLGRLTDAAKAYERCIRLGQADPANEASLQVYIGWCRCLYELGELTRAADIGKAALAEFEAAQAHESELSIQLIATVAAVWYELGDLREAERLLDEGLRRATGVRSPTARGAIVWNASLVAYERGRYQQAIELSEEALRIFRGSDASRYLGKLLAAHGYLLLRCDPPRPDEALDSLRQALGELAETADPVDKAYVFTEMCYAHLGLGEVDRAIQAAVNARSLLGSTSQLEFARASTALAVALATRGEDERARELFTEAASLLERLGASRHAARSWIELAHALTDAGRLPEAIAAHENAARALSIDDPRWHQRRGVARLPVGRPRARLAYSITMVALSKPDHALTVPRIAVGPSLDARVQDAIRRGGGTPVAAGEPADGLVWLEGKDADGLRAALRSGPGISWVQLPFAGVESFAGQDLFTGDHVWTCAKGAYAEVVAEHALALALAGLRGLPDRVRARSWGPQGGVSLFGQPVTILGGGGITQTLIDLLRPFRARVTVVRRRAAPIPGAERVVTQAELHKVLPGALVVFVALALTPLTQGIIGAPELALMDRGAWLINVARGGHVVTGDLVAALERGQIGGAGLDVTDPEPLPSGHPLWDLPNCIITPHTANSIEMLVPKLAERITANVRRFAAGEPLEGRIDPAAGY